MVVIRVVIFSTSCNRFIMVIHLVNLTRQIKEEERGKLLGNRCLKFFEARPAEMPLLCGAFPGPRVPFGHMLGPGISPGRASAAPCS